MVIKCMSIHLLNACVFIEYTTFLFIFTCRFIECKYLTFIYIQLINTCLIIKCEDFCLLESFKYVH